MKYVVSVEVDGKRAYYRRLFFQDDFVESIYEATLYTDKAKAERVERYIRTDWKPQFISETVKILPVKIEVAVA